MITELFENLSVGFIQADIVWQNAKANYIVFENKFIEWQDENKKYDLVILPEMFTTGFSMQTKLLAENSKSKTLTWLKKMAKKYNFVLIGSFIFEENKQFFNRLFVVFPDGTFLNYDKKHLFRMADEHQHFSEGKSTLVFEWKGWKIMPLICYDLRFPIWSRNVFDEEKQAMKYDLLIYIANFPAARQTAWKYLLRARAIENLAYCIGVNRCGTDGNGIFYSGDSAVINFLGETITELDEKNICGQVALDLLDLKAYRQKFPAYKDADCFELK